jgi:hypothetical protein
MIADSLRFALDEYRSEFEINVCIRDWMSYPKYLWIHKYVTRHPHRQASENLSATLSKGRSSPRRVYNCMKSLECS